MTCYISQMVSSETCPTLVETQVGDEAASHFSTLCPSLVHVAPDVATAVAHIKAVLPA